jgi:hypothetical protein
MDQKEGKQATIGNQVCEKLAAHLSIHGSKRREASNNWKSGM